MYISKICFKNFRCFGPEETVLHLEPDLTFFVGNNGTGKSTVFYALKKIFGSSNEERTITKEDFYLNQNEKIDKIDNREMYIDVTFDFPELSENDEELTTVSAFEHSIFADADKIFRARIRLEAKWSSAEYADDVETKLYWVKTTETVVFGDDYELKTAVELAKRVGLQIDTVKKKLKVLYDNEIVRCTGLNPKCWKFDEYNYQRLDEDNEIYKLLCSFEDVDFDRYFIY